MTRPLTLYVAGPMTGLPDYNIPAFHAATERLEARGYLVLNPARHNRRHPAVPPAHLIHGRQR